MTAAAADPAVLCMALVAMGGVASAGVIDSLRLPADAGAQVVGTRWTPADQA